FIFQYLLGCFERLFFLFSDSYSIPVLIQRIHDLFHLFRENFEGGSYYQFITLQKDISICLFTFFFLIRPLFFYIFFFFFFFYNSYSIPFLIQRIHDLFHLFRENFEGGSYYQLTTLQKDISICHLTFSYTTRPLFSDFSLFISYGDKVLLTGESGGGKSTLVKMLMRYIEVPFGMIRIGEIDINHYHLD